MSNTTLEPQLENTHETPPSSRAEGLLFLHGLESNPGSSLQTEEEAGAQGVSGPSSSCVWNPRVFADDARGWRCPFVLCLQPQGCLRRGVRVLLLLSRFSHVRLCATP